MYHKSAEQISQEKIIIPNPDVVLMAKAARELVAQFGTVEDINNFVKAHITCGKFIETLKDRDETQISDTLGVMQVLESLVSQAVVGSDRITIIKFK